MGLFREGVPERRRPLNLPSGPSRHDCRHAAALNHRLQRSFWDANGITDLHILDAALKDPGTHSGYGDLQAVGHLLNGKEGVQGDGWRRRI